MRVESLSLVNLGPFGAEPLSDSAGYSFQGGQHRFEFAPGAIAISGPNGVGKTSLVDFIYAGLTGDFGRFDGVSADCVNHHAGPNDNAYLSLHFVHDGASVRVLRQLRTRATFELVLNRSKVIKSEKGGTALLRDMGIDKRILDFCVFKRQPGSEKHAIDDFLRTTPARRAEAYMALHQTEHCQVIYDAVTAMLLHDQGLATEAVDDLDALGAQLAGLEAQRDDFYAQLYKLSEKHLLPAHLQKVRELLGRAERRAEQQANLKRLEADRVQRQNELIKQEAERVHYQEEVRALEAQVQALQPRHETAFQALLDWIHVDQVSERRRALMAQQEQLEREQREQHRPVRPDGPTSEQLRAERSSLEQRCQVAKQHIRLFEEQGLTVCPTCGTEVGHLAELLEEDRRLLVAAKRSLPELTVAIECWDNFRAASDEYNEWKIRYAERVASVRAALENLDELATPAMTRKEAEEVKAEFSRLGRQLRAQQQQLQKADGVCAGVTNMLSFLEEKIKAARHDLAVGAADEAAVARARLRLQEHEQAALQTARLEGQVAGLAQRIHDGLCNLDRARARLARTRQARHAVKVLERLRDLFHKQSLPQQVAQTNLALMARDINDNLARYGSPFWVEADANLSFLVHKPGAPAHRAERLSGGQKAVLALAFWPAVNSLYQTGLGVLVLDEPTANLDADNVGRLREALGHWTRQLHGQRQLFVITHDESLLPAFDQVFRLGRR